LILVGSGAASAATLQPVVAAHFSTIFGQVIGYLKKFELICDDHLFVSNGIGETMMAAKLHRTVGFNLPANYRICVKGYLDESWVERLSGFLINNQVSDGESPVSVLTGSTRDQTELIGVLNGLYEMHLPLLSVEILDDDELEG
jgi:hypothetical protein